MRNLWLRIQLRFYSILLSILTGMTWKIKIKHNGEVIAREQLEDGRIAEIYVENGEYKCRIVESKG